MASSPQTPSIKIQDRSSLYHGRYQYSVSAYQFECLALRGAETPEQVLDRVAVERTMRDWRSKNFGGSWIYHQNREKITDEESSRALLETHYRLQGLDDVKAVFTVYDFFYLYCNDLQPVLDSGLLEHAAQVEIRQAALLTQPGTIKLRSSPWLYRTYFREKLIGESNMAILRNLLYSQSELRITDRFRESLDRGYRYLFANYFVDHSSSSLPLLIELALPGAVRKTLDIVIAK